jgi:hypothetical protein
MKKIALFIIINIFASLSYSAGSGCESKALTVAKKNNPNPNANPLPHKIINGITVYSKYYNPRTGRFTGDRDKGGYRVRFSSPNSGCYDYYDVSTKKSKSDPCLVTSLRTYKYICNSPL